MKQVLDVELPTTDEEFTMFSLQHNFNPFKEGLIAGIVHDSDFEQHERNKALVDSMNWIAETLKYRNNLVEYFCSEKNEVVLFIARVFICVISQPLDDSKERLDKEPITKYILSIRDLILQHGNVRDEDELISRSG